MSRTLLVAIAASLAATTASASERSFNLKAECSRVHKVYPLLMLASMLEGSMSCGSSDDGSDYVDCAADETPEQKVADARRFEIRQHQEAAYKAADSACTAWDKNRTLFEVRTEAEVAVVAARTADS